MAKRSAAMTSEITQMSRFRQALANRSTLILNCDKALRSVGKHTILRRFRRSTAATGGGRYKDKVFRQNLKDTRGNQDRASGDHRLECGVGLQPVESHRLQTGTTLKSQ